MLITTNYSLNSSVETLWPNLILLPLWSDQVPEKSKPVGARSMTYGKGYTFQNQLASYLTYPLPQTG